MSRIVDDQGTAPTDASDSHVSDADGARLVADAKDSPTITALMKARAVERATRVAYTYMADGETVSRSITYAELDRGARALAARMQALANPGDRALILTWDNIDFILAFIACQYAGVIAVPAYPPFPIQSKRRLATLEAIAQDCGARLVLGSPAPLRAALEEAGSEVAGRAWIEIDEVDDACAEQFQPVDVRDSDVSFLQYTSGSTALPKGVVITHAALMSNERLISACFGSPQDGLAVGWVPLYHDMGLIGYVLQTIYVGAGTILMSPLAFVQRPLRWLQAISRYGADYSGGPNFAYELCVRRITPAEREGLDLSRWKLAFNGAEPVRARALDAFAQAFEPYGFDARAFYPCYGLAESTLIATGGIPGAGASRLRVDAAALRQGRLVPGADHELVGAGAPTLHRRLEIVDPASCARVQPGDVGEIWIAGPDVASGYWGAREDVADAFAARLADESADGEGEFLRTGDLGAMHAGELYVTGRLKDVIIVDGRNHYPQDIELTAESSHAALRRGCCAAFALERAGAETVAVVAEVKDGSTADLEQVTRAVRSAVVSQHGMPNCKVMLVPANSVPKTSSGKLQRRACRAALVDGELTLLDPRPKHEVSEEHVADWLVERITSLLETSADAIPLDQPFVDLGLSSLQAVELSEDLGRRYGLTLLPTLAFDYPTIEAVAAYIADEAQAR